MDLLGATVERIAPATWVTDNGRRTGIRFPLRSGTGDPSVNNWQAAHGGGQADGGVVVVRTLTNRFGITDLRPTLNNGVVSAAYKVNGVESRGESLVRTDLAQGRLLANPGPAGQPQTIQVDDVPVYATPGLLDAVRMALGALLIGPDTVIGHVRSELLYTPPQP